jgi:hypothetical protein
MQYRLAPWVRILDDAHDLPALLARVRGRTSAEPPQPADTMDELRSCLISVLPESVNVSRLDTGVALILEMFTEPRTPLQVTREIQELTKIKFDSDAFFAEAAAHRILVPVGATLEHIR